MKRLHFPHISRLFSAGKSIPLVPTLLWSVMAACIITNIRVSSAYDAATVGVIDAMTKKSDGTLNRLLSERFEKSGITVVAWELRRSKELFATDGNIPPTGDGVLASQTQTVKYWENILAERPDYRDAYLAAAKSALLENNLEGAIDFIKQALQIDPNDRTARVLLTLVEKNGKK